MAKRLEGIHALDLEPGMIVEKIHYDDQAVQVSDRVWRNQPITNTRTHAYHISVWFAGSGPYDFARYPLRDGGVVTTFDVVLPDRSN